jgi:hypothetical protein
MRTLFVLSALSLSASALACPGKDASTAAAAAPAADTVAAAEHCAKKADLLGSACSFTTTSMAQRVLAEGKTYTYTGTLVAAENQLSSHVAAPYTVGPKGQIHVVANEVVENLSNAGAQAGRVTLQGRTLEVDGVQYFVMTSFQAGNS